MRFVSSANVACGGHAGDDESMRAVCQHAAEHRIAIGAQVSYPDRAGFGRVLMEIDTTSLARSLEDQFDALAQHAHATATTVRFVKPHGALYNAVVTREDHARVVVNLAAQREVSLVGLPNSCSESLAKDSGVRFVREWFADRGYLSSGVLVPRVDTGALVTSPEVVQSRVRKAIRHGLVDTVDGASIAIDFSTICVHSDTPGAAALLAVVRETVDELDFEVRSI